MKRFFFLLTIWLALIQLVSAQSTLLKGRVVSNQENLPLNDVTIRLKGALTSVNTDSDGQFSIPVERN